MQLLPQALPITQRRQQVLQSIGSPGSERSRPMMDSGVSGVMLVEVGDPLPQPTNRISDNSTKKTVRT